MVGRIVNSRRVDNLGVPPQKNRHPFFQDSSLYLSRTFVVHAPYMRRTLAVHASAKAAFFMLNIENTAFADVYTAYIRLRYDLRTTQVDIKGRVEVSDLAVQIPQSNPNIHEPIRRAVGLDQHGSHGFQSVVF